MWRGGQRLQNADPLVVQCLSLECRAAEPSGCEGFALSVLVTEEGLDVCRIAVQCRRWIVARPSMPSVKPVEDDHALGSEYYRDKVKKSCDDWDLQLNPRIVVGNGGTTMRR